MRRLRRDILYLGQQPHWVAGRVIADAIGEKTRGAHRLTLRYAPAPTPPPPPKPPPDAAPAAA